MATKKKTDEALKEAESKVFIQQEKEPVMYLGPTFSRIGLKTNQLFRGGIPEQYDKEPYKRLFAEPLQISALKKSIKTQGTAANIAYKDVLAEINGME